MKRCPTCQRTYTDDTLRFCLEDGSALLTDSRGGTADPEATIVSEARPGDRSSSVEPPPTEILSSPYAQTIAAPASGRATSPGVRPAETVGGASDGTTRRDKPRNTAIVAVVSVVGTILILSLCALGVMVYLKNKREAGQPRTGGNEQENRQTNNTGLQVNNATPNANRPNVNTRPSPSPSLAHATPTPAPVDAAAVASQVTSALNGWASATTARDLNSHMSYYADTLDTYYSARGVSASRVRADRERAFNIYSSMDVQLSNIRVTPDQTGQRATVTFDKTWTFEGDKYSNGSVQQLVTLAKINGRWRITGEKDLQVYYVNR